MAFAIKQMKGPGALYSNFVKELSKITATVPRVSFWAALQDGVGVIVEGGLATKGDAESSSEWNETTR
jgi:hypothetical protein